MPIGAVLPETSLVIDSDIFTDWRYRKPYVEHEIEAYISRAKKPPALTSINVFEAIYGFENKFVKAGALDHRTTQDFQSVKRLIRACIVLQFDEIAASIAAYIFARLSKSDRSKHWKDTFIAATAIAHGYGLATRNRDDFELIAGNLPPDRPFLRLVVWNQ
jgi:predicted nucleic acid-binding protein